MRHAFISYVREDARQVDHLQAALEAAGIPVWRDTTDLWPGEDWRVKIRRAITDDALIFIACFSKNSLARARSYQNEELVLAIEELRLRRPDVPWIIPVRFDDCDIPDLDIGRHRTLNALQRADLFGEQLDQQTSRLVAVFKRILGSGDTARVGAQAGKHRSPSGSPVGRVRAHPANTAEPVFNQRIDRPSERSAADAADSPSVPAELSGDDSSVRSAILGGRTGERLKKTSYALGTAERGQSSDAAAGSLQDQLNAMYLEARAKMNAEDYEIAIDLLNRVIALDPAFLDASALRDVARNNARLSGLYVVAVAAQARHDWRAAIRSFDDLLVIDAQFKDAAVRKQECQLRLGAATIEAVSNRDTETIPWPPAMGAGSEGVTVRHDKPASEHASPAPAHVNPAGYRNIDRSGEAEDGEEASTSPTLRHATEAPRARAVPFAVVVAILWLCAVAVTVILIKAGVIN